MTALGVMAIGRKEEYFLEYNKGNIFHDLIQCEIHLRRLKDWTNAEHASCIIKHLADIEGEADEAVSHSLVAESSEASSKFRELRDRAIKLRVQIQRRGVNPDEAILKVRELKDYFGEMYPPFNISACKSCGVEEGFIRDLRELSTEGLEGLESTFARHVIQELSAKHGVKPPKLVISDSCHDPDKGQYFKGEIRMCRSGISEHVLLHEFKHYLQHLEGKKPDEGEAEAFAVDTVEKGLYAPFAKHSHKASKMNSKTKDVALVIGGVNIGWGIGYSAKAFIDPMAPGAIMGQDPSLLIDVGGTIAAIIAALKLKGDMAKKLSAYIAAGLSTHIWEDLTKLLPAAPAAPSAVMVGAPVLGMGAVGSMIPAIPATPTPARRLAGYPFPSPVSVGGTMSPPHYTLNGVPGLRTVALTPKYTLDTF